MDRDLTIWLHNNPYNNKSEAKPHSDAILQQLLQNTLNTSQPVQIFKNENGKPYIKEPVYFSHTNSENLYAYVISTQGEVAVDLEYIKPDRQFMPLAHRYFAADEIELLNSLEPPHNQLKFFQLWTRKEAWCKLDGGNLWAYLKRSVLQAEQLTNQQGTLIHMKHNDQISGFTCALASTHPVKQIWLNSIG